MNMQYVDSSTIQAIGYDAVTKTLRISFHKSGIYDYPNIPYSLYQSLMNAPSIGSFHAQYIKHLHAVKIG